MFEHDRRDPPVVEDFVFDGSTISVTRQHCVDSDEPDEDGSVEWYYEFDTFEFLLDNTKLHGRAYTHEPGEASFLSMDVDGRDVRLRVADFESLLVRAASEYFRRAGRRNLTWLDPDNRTTGYSPIPESAL